LNYRSLIAEIESEFEDEGFFESETPSQDGHWGSKKWPNEENEWNALYQQAVQGLAGGNLKPEKIAELAATVSDFSMLLFHRHGKQMWCAMNAAADQNSKSVLNLVLAYGVGSKGVWGDTFRSAIQSTTSGVDGPISAKKAVQRAGDIADQAARAMLGESLWKLYINCRQA
jgi:hypothetical protein